MEKTKRQFFRKTIKVGNSAGVLLPKSLLGADVRIIVVNPPLNIKKNALLILEPFLEEIIGVYLVSSEKRKIEILAVSTKVREHIEKSPYFVDIVPLATIKKSLKQQKIREKISKAKAIINKKLLEELKKEI